MRWVVALLVALAGCDDVRAYLVQPGALAQARAEAERSGHYVAVPAARPDGERVFLRSDAIVATRPTDDPRWLRATTQRKLAAATAGVVTLLAGIATLAAGILLIAYDPGGHCDFAGCDGAKAGVGLLAVGGVGTLVGAVIALAGQFQHPAEVVP